MSPLPNTLNPLKFPTEMGKLFMKMRRVENFEDGSTCVVEGEKL